MLGVVAESPAQIDRDYKLEPAPSQWGFEKEKRPTTSDEEWVFFLCRFMKTKTKG